MVVIMWWRRSPCLNLSVVAVILYQVINKFVIHRISPVVIFHRHCSVYALNSLNRSLSELVFNAFLYQVVLVQQVPSWNPAPWHGLAVSSEEAFPPAGHRWRGATLWVWVGKPRARSGPVISGAGFRWALPGSQPRGACQRPWSAIWTPQRRLPQLLLPYSGAGLNISTARTLHSSDPWRGGSVPVPQTGCRFQQRASEEGLGCDLEQPESIILQGPSPYSVSLQSHNR